MTILSAVLCCDASPQQGLGHLQRCRVLAQTIVARGGQAHILCITQNGSDLGPEPANVGMTMAPIGDEQRCLEKLVHERQATLLIIDHYRADPGYQRQLEEFALPWLQFDYRHAFEIRARWIVNINPFASADAYVGLVADNSRLLLGPQYAILRSEFNVPNSYTVGEVRNVLVMLGGGDDRGVAQKLIGWLSKENVEMQLVTTRLNPRLADLQRLALENTMVSLLIEPPSIAELMCGADLAISAGGTTTFELVSQRIPFLSVALADNQVNLCKAWESLGVSLHLGNISELDEAGFHDKWRRVAPLEERMKMRQNASCHCDSAGAERIVREIETWL